MTKIEFEDLFESVVVRPLSDLGFKGRGKSQYLTDGSMQFAWMRVGGRFAAPGCIAHILAFRHVFLRDMEERVPEKAPSNPEHYPWVFNPEQLSGSGPRDWFFNPQRLSDLPFGFYCFDDKAEDAVRSHLQIRVNTFVHDYMPWAKGLSRRDAIAQMRRFKAKWWAARLWSEDYDQQPDFE